MKEKKTVRNPLLYGIEMCWKCYAFLHGVGLTTVADMRKRAEASTKVGDHKEWVHQGKNQDFHPSPARDAVIRFLTNLREKLGESDPTKKGYVQLPADTKANHYIDFQLTEGRAEGFLCTYAYFCETWKKHFPQLILPKSTRWVRKVFL